MGGEEEEVEDDGKTVARAKGGAINLARIAGKTRLVREAGEISLARETGGISLAMIAHKATRASLLYHHNRGGMKTIIRTRGLGASKSRVQLLASWVAPRPQPHSASSRSLLVR